MMKRKLTAGLGVGMIALLLAVIVYASTDCETACDAAYSDASMHCVASSANALGLCDSQPATEVGYKVFLSQLGLPDDFYQSPHHLTNRAEWDEETLKAEIEKERAEAERLRAEIERRITEADQKMHENIAAARAHAKDFIERRGREYYPLPEASNNRWVIVMCFNGAAIFAMLALYFYHRWRKNRLLP
ncbi:MAG: hypothetical protein FWG73_00465 [Planctomycetaceae bacterium]|nr:hypothetical protein [Planctomycetaceae bacterium]